MRTVPIKTEHARAIAALHIHGIDKGFISSLGMEFVTALYEAIARSKSSFGYAVEEHDRVLGFVTFTTNLNRLYKSVIAQKGWHFAFLLAGKMFSVRLIKKVLETLLYPLRVRKNGRQKAQEVDLASAELLSIAVDPENCRSGLATDLVRKSFERCLETGMEKVKVLVAADNAPANKLYQKCGFKLASQIENHGILSNIYQADVREALELLNGKENRPSTYYFAPNLDSVVCTQDQKPAPAVCVA
jgi:ribosomal protein S18 acetylase RimI-like enzyme